MGLIGLQTQAPSARWGTLPVLAQEVYTGHGVGLAAEEVAAARLRAMLRAGDAADGLKRIRELREIIIQGEPVDNSKFPANMPA